MADLISVADTQTGGNTQLSDAAATEGTATMPQHAKAVDGAAIAAAAVDTTPATKLENGVNTVEPLDNANSNNLVDINVSSPAVAAVAPEMPIPSATAAAAPAAPTAEEPASAAAIVPQAEAANTTDPTTDANATPATAATPSSEPALESVEVDPELTSKIVHQVEFYFSNSNLPKDKFLKTLYDRDGGW